MGKTGQAVDQRVLAHRLPSTASKPGDDERLVAEGRALLAGAAGESADQRSTTTAGCRGGCVELFGGGVEVG